MPRHAAAAGRSFRGLLLGLLLACLPAQSTFSAEHHVAPHGSYLGNGSRERPWDVRTALSGAAAVHPGDTVWLHGGVYRGGVVSRLQGRAEAPIVVRSAPGEWAVFDGAPSGGTGDARLVIEGAHAIYRDFEVVCSQHRYRTTHPGPDPPDVRASGIHCEGSHVKLVNLVVHQTSGAVGWSSNCEGGEVYGCLIFHNGWDGPDRGHGHGLYAQNKEGVKRIVDNIVFNQFGYGLHCYGTPKAFLRNFHIEGNICFHNGRYADREANPAILVGGGSPVGGVTLRGNFTYGGDVRCGYPWWDARNDDVAASDNYIAGGLHILNFARVSGGGNTIVAPEVLVQFNDTRRLNLAEYAWNRNTYFQTRPGAEGFAFQDGQRRRHVDFAEWERTVRLDGGSRWTLGRPASAAVFVRPNAYARGRAHIIVYNWPRSHSVEADLDAVLKRGQAYEVLEAQDYFGEPVARGVYDGRPLRLPMQPDRERHARAGGRFGFPDTKPEFGVFVVRPTAASQERTTDPNESAGEGVAGNGRRESDPRGNVKPTQRTE